MTNRHLLALGGAVALASCVGCTENSDAEATSPIDGGWAGDSPRVDASAAVDSGWTPDGAPPVCPPVDAAGFHVTLDGTPTGDGTLAAPWNIATGLDRPPGVVPGSTIWIHAGRYIGTFVVKQEGLAGAPVTMRAWPGDRVILDSNGDRENPVVQMYHEWMVLQDLEITDSNPDRRSSRTTGIYVGADHVALVNLVIHDVGTGITGGQLTSENTQEGTDILVYGSVFYNNGWLGEDRGHGHHVYLTNRDSVMRVEENVLFYAYGFGIHNYSSSDRNYVCNNEIVGNVWFLNGVPGGKLSDNCMVGHDGTLVMRNVLLRENYGWALSVTDRDVRLGWDTPNENARLENNYLVGSTIFQNSWTGIAMDGNTFIGPLEGANPSDFPNNTYLDAPPVKNHVAIRPNRFEPGRAHVVVYNWEGLEAVSADLSAVLPVGAEFELRSAQQLYDPPVVQGVYGGGDVTIPVTGLGIHLPMGDENAIPVDQRTGRAFNVFVLRSRVCG